jgi:gluconate 5-dehydrogenase
MSLFDLTGRTALVTGSSRGLGAAIAGGFAEAGARVVINGRDQARLAEAAAAFKARGIDVETSLFDVTDDSAVTAEIARIEAEVGPIDILVNNAGLQQRAPLEEFPLADFRRMLETHVTAAFVTGRAVAAGMIRRRRGKIINICSLMSEVGRNTITPYTTAKGALKMLTKGMAVEWAKHGLQINGIGPGYFATEMNKALIENPEFDRFVRSRTPAGRWGDPGELIGPAVFLASDASNFMNGQILYVDGGILASL